VIPHYLAYGDAGSGNAIKPGATLKFDIELFKVIDPASNRSPETSDEETELVTLPDGTKIRVPKGVKVRMIDSESQ
jgi:hypothetical protein